MSCRFLLGCAFLSVLPGFLMAAFAQTEAPSGQGAATDRSSAVQSEQWEQEMLRDPFWPVGFFPEGWQKKTAVQGASDMDVSGWETAAGKIRISGTSRLGERTAAIVNGELKSTGDQIEVLFEGKTYQWQIIGIDTAGRVQLKKQGIR